jgi:superfamily II DNA/RNA helicase
VSSSFADLGVPHSLVDALERADITEPSPIQAAVLPDALEGKDVCGKAPTGSGKTLAFGLAIAVRAQDGESHRPRALVLTPTRELAVQVRNVLGSLLTRSQGSVAIHGGVGYKPQLDAIRRGVDTLIATPGRLQDLLDSRQVSLDGVEQVVIDEADRMADMGFLPAVRQILDLMNHRYQLMLFSATLDGDIDKLVKQYAHDPVIHDVVGLGEEGDVEHERWAIDPSQRFPMVLQLVEGVERAVVFCRSKHGTDRLAEQLERAGVRVASLHGDHAQKKRQKAIDSFTRGHIDVLVATDVAARGIHVDAVDLVVHADVPADAKDYKHRSGRTGRAGMVGRVVMLVPPNRRKMAERIVGEADVDAPIVTPPRPGDRPRQRDDGRDERRDDRDDDPRSTRNERDRDSSRDERPAKEPKGPRSKWGARALTVRLLGDDPRGHGGTPAADDGIAEPLSTAAAPSPEIANQAVDHDSDTATAREAGASAAITAHDVDVVDVLHGGGNGADTELAEAVPAADETVSDAPARRAAKPRTKKPAVESPTTDHDDHSDGTEADHDDGELPEGADIA